MTCSGIENWARTRMGQVSKAGGGRGIKGEGGGVRGMGKRD